MLADRCQDEDQLTELDYQIGMAGSPEAEALRALREHQEAMGMAFDNPGGRVAVPDQEDVPGWMLRDEAF